MGFAAHHVAKLQMLVGDGDFFHISSLPAQIAALPVSELLKSCAQ
jgi:hypothetical protein